MPLSNSTQQVLATTPYFDDYYQANTVANTSMGVDFDFHRVLFRPRYGVQARELTQLQTLLQVQLERLGSAQFRNGDRVFGCSLTLDVSATSGQVLANTTFGNFFNRETNTGKYVFATTNNSAKARITQYMGIDEGQVSNNYLIFKYSGNDEFVAGQVIQDRDDSTISATFVTGAAFGDASTISIDEGVCFVSGFFVRVRPQTIVLDPLSSTPSYRIGLTIDEQILDELDDVVGESLGDPANRQAPGAHRLRVRLSLAKKSLSTDADDNFIELARVENGVIRTNRPNNTLVSMRELLTILARRTYDESGDYMIRAFPPVLEGAASANSTNSANVTTFMLSLGQGKAYVRGSEIETTEPTRVTVNKSRDTVVVESASLAATVGNYMIVSRVGTSAPKNFFGNTGTVELHCLPIANVNIANNTTYAYSRIGTTRVRMLEVDEVPNSITNYANTVQYFNASTYKLFFFDTRFDTLTGTITTATTASDTGQTTLYIASPANGLPYVNNALDGVSISISGNASGIYTIDEYLRANGTHVSLLLKEYLISTPANNTSYRLLFQPRDIDAFACFNDATDMSTPYTANLSFQADVAAKGKDSGLPTGYSKIFNPNDSSLVYQIPELYLAPGSASPESVQFVSWIASETVNTGTGSTTADVTLSWSTLNSYINFPIDADASAEQASESFLLFDITDDPSGRGHLIHFSDSANNSSRCATAITVNDTSIEFTYHHGTTISSARTLVAIGKANLTGVPPRIKTYYSGNTTHALAGTSNALLNGQVEYHTSLNTAPGASYSFKTADVINLKKVLYKSDGTSFANIDMTTATDVTSYFTLETGQRDNSYDYSSAIVKRGASGAIAPTGRLLFIFDWFDHTGQGYVHLDSYLSAVNVAKGFTYEDVPFFTSQKSNRTISLRNVIDFRPVQSNKEFLAAETMVMTTSNTSANTTYLTNDTQVPYLIPVSDRNWDGSYAYYLSRKDRVLLYPDGSFVVKEGKPAVSPQLPPVDSDAMLLFDLNVPAYTLVDDDGVPTQVKIKSYDYKRYTMKDLSKIEDRVAHLEYYTALSQLEKNARDQSILDVDNQERFKNGIVVDAFTGTAVADVTRDDFTASIDTRKQLLRPAFEYAGDAGSTLSIEERTNPQITFMPDTAASGTTNVTVAGDLATLAYASAPFITQPLATRHVSVNPFSIANYNGSIVLEPAVDTGKSLAPAQVIDMGGPTAAWVEANLPSYTNWGEWETTWTGITERYRRHEWWTPEDWTEEDHAFQAVSLTTYEDITTQTLLQRQGTQFDFESVATTTSIGNVIVDSYVIHNMRQRDVVFAATGMKANTIIYPFFDGSNVAAYIQHANALRLDACPVSVRPSFKIGDTVHIQKPLTGTVSVSAGSTTLTGTNTVFVFELGAEQLVKIVSGNDAYLRTISTVASNTSLTLRDASPTNITITNGRVYSYTPVTIADVTERRFINTNDNNIEYVQITLKVVRVNHLGQPDDVVPYVIQAGSLSPNELVLAGAGTTNTASLIAPPRMWTPTGASAFSGYLTFAGDSLAQTYGEVPIVSATIRSGVVRAYNAGAHTVRLDLDAPNTITNGTRLYFVNGAAAGQSVAITAYDTATQTVTVDSTVTLSNITAGKTIYSLDALRTDGFLPVGDNTLSLYDSNTLSALTVTGASGTCAGALHIQENQFPVGARIFRLIDDINNNPVSATTRAEGTYTASGLIQVESTTSITTRDVVRTSRGVTDTDSRIDRSTVKLGVEWVDPVAQSFNVDDKDYPSGIFITHIDIAFASKPPVGDETPIQLQLRPMVNGYPSSTDVISMIASSGRAEVELRPAAVKVTQTPNFVDTGGAPQYTRFTFTAPVHLKPGSYAIVLISNSDEYRVYTAAVSEPVLGTQNIVGAQPYAGSFFKSQNASTWTAEQNEDLMFRISKAEWSVNDSGTIVFRAAPFASNATYDTLTTYTYDGTFEGKTAITYAARVMPMNPITEDLTGSIGVTYNITPSQTLTLPTRAMMLGRDAFIAPVDWTTGTANTIDLTATFTTRSTDVAPFIDIKKLSAVGVRHLLNDMPLQEQQFEITSPGSGYPRTANNVGTVTFGAGDTVITGTGTSFTTTLIVGRDVVIGGDLAVTVASITNDTTFTITAATGQARTANTYATYANAVITISASDVGEDATAIGVVSAVSSSNITGILTSIVVTSNGSGYLTSPTVTANGATPTNATVVYRGEDWTSGGNGLTRYMIKPITLADGFEARDIKVYFDAVRPYGSNFYVYYRTLGSADDANTLENASWRLMYQDTDDAVISVLPNQFREFSFSTLNNTTATNADTSERFRAFTIKIVMASNTTAGRIIPAVRNFRAIALDN